MVMAESLLSLVNQLSEKIRDDDISAFIDASKDDGIDEKELQNLSSTSQWFDWLCEKLLLTNDDLSFIEHVFELCRRPDLLTIVIEYRLKNLKSDEDELPARQCIRVPSAKKYMAAKLQTPDGKKKPDLLLSDPPKTRRKSTAS